MMTYYSYYTLEIRHNKMGLNHATTLFMYIYVCERQPVVLPGHTRQVGQHVVKLPVCYFSKCGELWEHNDGTAVVSSPSCGTKSK